MAKEKGLFVRMNNAEHEKITNSAADFDVSAAEFLRRLGMEKELPTPEEREDFLRIIFLLERSGNNLNQIATHMNASRKRGATPTTTEKEILTAALEARNIHSYLKKQVKSKWQF
jgi:hypothetical protein